MGMARSGSVPDSLAPKGLRSATSMKIPQSAEMAKMPSKEAISHFLLIQCLGKEFQNGKDFAPRFR
jgi:hypothetical protein